MTATNLFAAVARTFDAHSRESIAPPLPFAPAVPSRARKEAVGHPRANTPDHAPAPYRTTTVRARLTQLPAPSKAHPQ